MALKRKTRIGNVVSDKMDKTVIIAVDTVRHHPLYRKTLRRVVKYKAHDEKNEYHVGDLVKIEESRPLSKEKHWRVVEMITRGEVAEVKPEEIT
ncbi:30S ribosomal protein S17 [Chloroflexota bacterium]